MKLNKPIITICIIILLVVDLIFFSFLSIGKNLGEEECLNEITENFDFKKYVLNNDIISYSINNNKYNKEVFDYMDELKIKILKKNTVNNLLKEKEVIIDKNDVKEILSDSVYEYEHRNMEDIYNYVSNDINQFSNNIQNKVDNEYSEIYYFVINTSNSIVYLVSLVLIILFISLIIIFEKKNGLFISSIILIAYSFVIYYLNTKALHFFFVDKSKYFNSLDLHLESLYVICFILGFVLLLIYIVNCLKKYGRELRLKSYGSWR